MIAKVERKNPKINTGYIMKIPYVGTINKAIDSLGAITLAVFAGALGALGISTLILWVVIYVIINPTTPQPILDYIGITYPAILMAIGCVIVSYKTIIIADELNEIQKIKKI